MIYNPYDLVDVVFNGVDTQARPIALSDDIADNNTMTNASGDLVKPTEFVTTCPTCGEGAQFSAEVEEPPFKLEYTCAAYCPKCPIKKSSVNDPFRAPTKIEDPTVSEHIEPVKAEHTFEETTPVVQESVDAIINQLPIEEDPPVAEEPPAEEPPAEEPPAEEPPAEESPAESERITETITENDVAEINGDLLDVLGGADQPSEEAKPKPKSKKTKKEE